MQRTIAAVKRALPPFYADLDLWLAERVALQTDPSVSCARGCTACCNLMALTTLAEGLLLADWLVRRPLDAQAKLIERLRATAAGLNTTPREYFTPKSQCAFLTNSGDCMAYAIRPTSCRVHYVISPVELCQPGVESMTRCLNTIQAEHAAHELSEQLTGTMTAGPLPNVVLHCLSDRAPSQGIVHPAEWLAAARPS